MGTPSGCGPYYNPISDVPIQDLLLTLTSRLYRRSSSGSACSLSRWGDLTKLRKSGDRGWLRVERVVASAASRLLSNGGEIELEA
jgi:hypothetical protein